MLQAVICRPQRLEDRFRVEARLHAAAAPRGREELKRARFKILTARRDRSGHHLCGTSKITRFSCATEPSQRSSPTAVKALRKKPWPKHPQNARARRRAVAAARASRRNAVRANPASTCASAAAREPCERNASREFARRRCRATRGRRASRRRRHDRRHRRTRRCRSSGTSRSRSC